MAGKRVGTSILLISVSILLSLVSLQVQAARTITGVIWDTAKKPVPNVQVYAWDKDEFPGDDGWWPDMSHLKNDHNGSANDLLGKAVTDAHGRYKITYNGGHWDPALSHADTRWRPDIYITVEIPVRGHNTIEGRSTVRPDHRLREDLTINIPDRCAVCSSQDKRRNVDSKITVENMTAFDPSLHGFGFNNDKRQVCVLPSCKSENIPILKGFPKEFQDAIKKIGSFNWALCGGFSVTALKRFMEQDCNNNKVKLVYDPVAGKMKLPAHLKEEMLQNHVEAFLTTKPGDAPKGLWFLVWQALPDRVTPPNVIHSIGSLTKGEWFHEIKPELDKQLPVVIGLITVKTSFPDFDSLTKNHIVLAVGYSEDKFRNEVTLYVYDPNYHDRLSRIIFNTQLRHSYLNIEQLVRNRPDPSNLLGDPRTEKKVNIRGFFSMVKSGLAYWPYGGQKCRADLKVASIAVSTQGTGTARLARASVRLESVKLRRRKPVDVPVSDLIPSATLSCDVKGSNGFERKVPPAKLSMVFYDETADAHRRFQDVAMSIGSFPTDGKYTIGCYVDPTIAPPFSDPDTRNNFTAEQFTLSKTSSEAIRIPYERHLNGP